MTKRFIENFIEELSFNSDYDYCFLLDKFMEMFEDGEVDLKQFKQITENQNFKLGGVVNVK